MYPGIRAWRHRFAWCANMESLALDDLMNYFPEEYFGKWRVVIC